MKTRSVGIALCSVALVALLALSASLVSAEDILISWGSSDVHSVGFDSPKVPVRAYISTGSINTVTMSSQTSVAVLENNRNISSWSSDVQFWPRSTLPGTIGILSDSLRIDTSDLNALLPETPRAFAVDGTDAYVLNRYGQLFIISGVADENGVMEYSIKPFPLEDIIADNSTIPIDTRFMDVKCPGGTCVLTGVSGRYYGYCRDSTPSPFACFCITCSSLNSATSTSRFYEVPVPEGTTGQKPTAVVWSANQFIYILQNRHFHELQGTIGWWNHTAGFELDDDATISHLAIAGDSVLFTLAPSNTMYEYSFGSATIATIPSLFLQDMAAGVAFTPEPTSAPSQSVPVAASSPITLKQLSASPGIVWMLMSNGRLYMTAVGSTIDTYSRTTGSTVPYSFSEQIVLEIWQDKEFPVVPSTHYIDRVYADPTYETVYLVAKPTSTANAAVSVQQFDSPDLDWNDASLDASAFNGRTTLYTWGVPSSVLGTGSTTVSLSDTTWYRGSQRLPRSIQLDHLATSLRDLIAVSSGAAGVMHAVTANGTLLTWGCNLNPNECLHAHPLSSSSTGSFLGGNDGLSYEIPVTIQPEIFPKRGSNNVIIPNEFYAFKNVSTGYRSTAALTTDGKVWMWGFGDNVPMKKKEIGFGRNRFYDPLSSSKAMFWDLPDIAFDTVLAFDDRALGVMANGSTLISGTWTEPNFDVSLAFGGLSTVEGLIIAMENGGYAAVVKDPLTGQHDLLATRDAWGNVDCNETSWGGEAQPARKRDLVDDYPYNSVTYCNLTGNLPANVPVTSIRSLTGLFTGLLLVTDSGLYGSSGGSASEPATFIVLPFEEPSPAQIKSAHLSAAGLSVVTFDGSLYTIDTDITTIHDYASTPNTLLRSELPAHLKVVGVPKNIGSFLGTFTALVQRRVAGDAVAPTPTASILPAGTRTTIAFGDQNACAFGSSTCDFNAAPGPITVAADHPMNSPTAKFLEMGRVGALTDERLSSGERRLIRWGAITSSPGVFSFYTRPTYMEQPIFFDAEALEGPTTDPEIVPFGEIIPFDIPVRKKRITSTPDSGASEGHPLVKMVTVGNTHILIYENCTMDIQWVSEQGPLGTPQSIANPIEVLLRSTDAKASSTSSTSSAFSSFFPQATRTRSVSAKRNAWPLPGIVADPELISDSEYPYAVDPVSYLTDHLPLSLLEFDYATCPNEKVVDLQCAELEASLEFLNAAPIPFHCVILTDSGSLYTLIAGLNNETCSKGLYGDRQVCSTILSDRANHINDPTWYNYPGLRKVDTTELDEQLPNGLHVKQIALGYNHIVAFTNDSRIVTWGSNEVGQLGLGDSSTVNGAGPVVYGPVGVGSAEKKRTASFLGRRAFGGLYKARADGVSYTLGSATLVNLETLTGGKLTKVAASGFATFALDSDSVVYGWGSNAHGELGRGASQSPAVLPFSNTPSRVVLPFEPIVDISCGLVTCYALYGSGEVYSWGSNVNGLLGRANASYATSAAVPAAPTVPTTPVASTPSSSSSNSTKSSKHRQMAKIKGPIVRPYVETTPTKADLIVLSNTTGKVPVTHFTATPTSPLVLVSGNGSTPSFTPDDTNCRGPRPSSFFRCLRGTWTTLFPTLVSDGSSEDADSRSLTSRTFVISSPVSVKGDMTLPPGSSIVFDIDVLGASTLFHNYHNVSIINVTGCFHFAGGDIKWKISSDATYKEFQTAVKNAGSDASVISISSNCEMQNSNIVTFQTVTTPSSCKKTGASVKNTPLTGSQQGLQTTFTVDQSRCNKWWIILLTVIAAVFIAVIIIVVVYRSRTNKNSRMDSVRLRSQSSVRTMRQ